MPGRPSSQQVVPGAVDTAGHAAEANSLILRLPLLDGLRGYRPSWLPGDIVAGLAVSAISLPTAIAYPAILGLPPQIGLFATMGGLVGYALIGPSRQLMMGLDAATTTVIAAVLASLLASMPVQEPAARVTLTALITLVVGGYYLAARLMRLGVLASFLSRPILYGFLAGVSLSILVGQIGRLTGFRIESGGLVPPLLELARRLGEINLPSLVLGLGMFALLQAIKAFRIRLPGPIVVVVLSIAFSAAFDFRSSGIAVVGEIPAELPSIALPWTPGILIDQLLLGAAAVFLVSFSSGIVSARSFGAMTNQPIDANRELVGLGGANLVSGFFGAFAVTASNSRSAINHAAGGRTQIAGLAAAAAFAAAIVFLTEPLAILPVPALGAILASTAVGMIDVDALRQIWRVSRTEFVFALIAMWGAIALGALQGVLIAVAATFTHLLRRSMFPRDAMLGRIPGRSGFYKLHRFREAKPVPGLAVCVIQGNLLFFSVDYLSARLAGIAAGLPPDTRRFVLDASAVSHVDSTAAAMLEEFRAGLESRGIALGFAELHHDARALLQRSGLLERIGPNMVFDDLEEVMAREAAV